MELTNLQNNLETITLNEQTNYRLMEISKTKDYFDQEIKHEQLLTNKLSKYITCQDYNDKTLTAVVTVFSGTNIFSHVKGKKRLLGLITSVFSLLFCLGSGVVKKLLYETQKKNKKHNKLLYLGKKLDCIEMLISKSVEDGIIDHNEFTAIINEKKEYDPQKNTIDENNVKLKLFNISYFKHYKHGFYYCRSICRELNLHNETATKR